MSPDNPPPRIAVVTLHTWVGEIYMVHGAGWEVASPDFARTGSGAMRACAELWELIGHHDRTPKNFRKIIVGGKKIREIFFRYRGAGDDRLDLCRGVCGEAVVHGVPAVRLPGFVRGEPARGLRSRAMTRSYSKITFTELKLNN